jgi:hypothetical protein
MPKVVNALNSLLFPNAADHLLLRSARANAHHMTGFGLLDFGISQARRGWLEAADVLNTPPLAGAGVLR